MSNTVHIQLQAPKHPKIGFGKAGPAYSSLGFSPEPTAGKRPLVAGAHGYKGVITPARVREWAQQYPGANTALRLEGALGLDVDDYGDKHGHDQLSALEARLGPLPPTWSSTSRGPASKARIYVFRVADDRVYKDHADSCIEVCSRTNRYMVVSPSVHPESGDEYKWYAPNGEESDGVPDGLHVFPELPAPWVEFLTQPPSSARFTHDRATAGPMPEARAWRDALVHGEDRMDPKYRQMFARRTATRWIGARDSLMTVVGAAVRDPMHPGFADVVDRIFTTYTTSAEATSPMESREADLWRALQGAIEKATADREARADESRLAASLWGPVSDLDETAFWTSRDYLEAILKRSRQTVQPPWTMLGVAIARALNSVPWNVHYESRVGRAPLNTLIANVGDSGTGKSEAWNQMDSGFDFRDPYTWQTPNEPGSGEGMTDWYKEKVKRLDEAGKERWIEGWRNPNHAHVFLFDEIGSMESRSGRQGATLLDTLKSAWSGQALTRVLASGISRELPAKQYRFAAVVNVQPARGQVLFTDNAKQGGLPSRFLFLSTANPRAEAEYDASPKETYGFRQANWDGVSAVQALPEMNDATIRDRFAKSRPDYNHLNSHLVLNRAKVAVALMVMDGRTALRSEDWELAGYVIEHSLKTRDQIQESLAGAAARRNHAQGKSAGVQKAVAEETAWVQNTERVAKWIADRRNAGKPAHKRDAASRDRKFFEDALRLFNERNGEPPTTE